MTIVVIENIVGSGQVITVREEYQGATVERELRPGENARIAVSRFKSVTVKENLAGALALDFASRGETRLRA